MGAGVWSSTYTCRIDNSRAERHRMMSLKLFQRRKMVRAAVEDPLREKH